MKSNEINKECTCNHEFKVLSFAGDIVSEYDGNNELIEKYKIKTYFCKKCGIVKAKKVSPLTI